MRASPCRRLPKLPGNQPPSQRPAQHPHPQHPPDHHHLLLPTSLFSFLSPTPISLHPLPDPFLLHFHPTPRALNPPTDIDLNLYRSLSRRFPILTLPSRPTSRLPPPFHLSLEASPSSCLHLPSSILLPLIHPFIPSLHRHSLRPPLCRPHAPGTETVRSHPALGNFMGWQGTDSEGETQG